MFKVTICFAVIACATIVAQQHSSLITYSNSYSNIFSNPPNSSSPIQTFPSLPPSGRNRSYLGEEVSEIGDVNGDGYGDYALGLKHAAQYPAGEKLGKVYVYFGSSIINIEKNPDIILSGEEDSDRFGNSISGAGDVNNDGFSDLIIGAYWSNAGLYLAGRAYIYLGGAGMDNIPDIIFNGEAIEDYFGCSVSSAGDVNNDGFSDVLIGASFNDGKALNSGRAYLYYGGVLMDNIADVVFDGEGQEDYFANCLAPTGDINNDGFSDIIIGAYQNDAAGVDAGRAYIYLGGSAMDNVADVIISGESALHHFGNSVDAAGDVNNDGFRDIIIGGDFAGKAYLFYGAPDMDNKADAVFRGESYYESFGICVSSGDINQDGFSDLFIGAPSGGNIVAGRVYVYFGSTTVDTIPDLIIDGESEFDFFGGSIVSSADINNDGFADLFIGAPWNKAAGSDAGRAYLYLGGTMIDNIPDLVLTGEASYDVFGHSAASAGDVNGDGYSDIVIGAERNDFSGIDAGCAYIYFGSPQINIVPDLVLKGESPLDFFGSCVSAAGDVNNDGYSDLIIGAPANEGSSFGGSAYIYYGGEEMNSIGDVKLTGEAAYDYFGSRVACAGDLNNDGYSDVIIGAYANDANGFDAGRAYIYFGGPDMDNIADIILTGESIADYFGVSISSAEDVNKDGFSDVIVGANFNDAGGLTSGRAYIYFGGLNMDNTADIILTGEESLSRFGTSVSSAGDVNNDGFSDVICSAPLSGQASGNAYLYYGGTAMDNVPDIIFSGEATGDSYGISVASAGDVNNDGFDDLIIGAGENDAGSFNAGRAYLYFGGVLMDTIPDAVWTGQASSDLFGNCVSSAGDVNNDSYSDILIGAEANCAVGYKMGRAYLFAGNSTVEVNDANNISPADYYLYQSYPNPFNAETTIKFLIPKPGMVTIKVTDILSREIRILVNEEKNPGTFEVIFESGGLSSGTYFYTIQSGTFSCTKKLTLLK